MVNERWTHIAGFPDYEISDQGRVRRLAAGQGTRAGYILKGSPNARGYLRVTLTRRHRSSKTHYIHRLVLAAFSGPEPPNHQTNHIDDNKANNAITNLEYKTSAHNNQHAWDTGLMPRIRKKQTHCRSGHELVGKNVVIKPQSDRNGRTISVRRCRICLNRNEREYRRHKKLFDHLAGVGE